MLRGAGLAAVVIGRDGEFSGHEGGVGESWPSHCEGLIGVSPKLFLRINRFQNALAQIKQQGYDKLSDVAFDNDYADQSHFLRDFQAFTGLAPFQYLKRTREVVANFS